jgi:hypothetical protein
MRALLLAAFLAIAGAAEPPATSPLVAAVRGTGAIIPTPRSTAREEVVSPTREALSFLIQTQTEDGCWRADGWPDGDGDGDGDRAATALALLAFSDQGFDHLTPSYPYQVVIRRGLRWLMDQRAGDPASDACVAMALTNLFSLTFDETLRAPAQAAIDRVRARQHASGGWVARGDPFTGPVDASTTTLCVLALKFGVGAGLDLGNRGNAWVLGDDDARPARPGCLAAARDAIRAALIDDGTTIRFPARWGAGTADTTVGTTGIDMDGLPAAALALTLLDRNDPARDARIAAALCAPGRVPTADALAVWFATAALCQTATTEQWRSWNERLQQPADTQRPDGAWDAPRATGSRHLTTCLHVLALSLRRRWTPVVGGKP